MEEATAFRRISHGDTAVVETVSNFVSNYDWMAAALSRCSRDEAVSWLLWAIQDAAVSGSVQDVPPQVTDYA